MFQLQIFSTVRNATLLTTSVLCVTIASQMVALAGYTPSNSTESSKAIGSVDGEYVPHEPSKPVTVGGSTGTRGSCEETSQPTSLTLLAPQEHIGRTTSFHPTFAWYVPSQQPMATELTLFEYGPKGRGKEIKTFQLQSSPGMMQWRLPTSEPGLNVGKTYLWQVTLICNRLRPSQNPWMEALVEVTAAPSRLKTVLSQTTDPLQKAKAYAEAGFWYDALAETFDTPAARSFRLSLLEQLSRLETSQQKAQLEQIVANERQVHTNLAF